jgi:hypothetical protein
MGIAIHYRGMLDDLSSIDDLCRELADIGKSMGWNTHVLNDSWTAPLTAELVNEDGTVKIKGNLGVKGVTISPGDGAESLSFEVDAKGRLQSLMNILAQCEGHPTMEQPWVSVKTQFASPDLHVWIIGLLKYLQRRYISDLEVSDEGGYWETGDRKALEAKMQFLSEKINWVSNELTSTEFGDMKGLAAEEIAARIAQHLQGRRNDSDSRSTDLE